jgi:hypothetical protein
MLDNDEPLHVEVEWWRVMAWVAVLILLRGIARNIGMIRADLHRLSEAAVADSRIHQARDDADDTSEE